MADFIVTGIVLNSIDYKEKDKLVKIFTAETGIISAVLKSVKNSNSKLKFAFQPFCFAQYELVKKGDFYTITQVNLLDSFFDIATNYDKFIAGQIMLKLCIDHLKQNYEAHDLFFDLINLLKELVYEDASIKLIILKFFLQLLNFGGYAKDFEECAECNNNLSFPIYFHNETGALVCKNCVNSDCIEFSKEQFAVYKMINNTNINKLHTLKLKPIIVDNLSILLKRVVENLLSVKIADFTNLTN